MRSARTAPGVASPPGLENDIDALARVLAALVRGHAGRLLAVTVTRPADVPAAHLSSLLSERLALAGIDFVEVDTETSPGPLRLVSVEFEA